MVATMLGYAQALKVVDAFYLEIDAAETAVNCEDFLTIRFDGEMVSLTAPNGTVTNGKMFVRMDNSQKAYAPTDHGFIGRRRCEDRAHETGIRAQKSGKAEEPAGMSGPANSKNRAWELGFTIALRSGKTPDLCSWLSSAISGWCRFSLAA